MLTHENAFAFCDSLGFELLDLATEDKERSIDEAIKNAGKSTSHI
jgi:hypothetical protein